MQVNIHAAKTNLSKLLKKVSEGEDVVIARSGKPIAKIVAYKTEASSRMPGSAKGMVRIAPDFNEPLPEDILEDFEQ